MPGCPSDSATTAEQTPDGLSNPPLPTMDPPVVMIVDDDVRILNLLGRMLERDGFSTRTFARGMAAFKALESSPDAIQVALIDLNLGEMSGLDLIGKLEQIAPLLVKIVITGDATLDNALECIRNGAYDFLQKPFQRKPLTHTLNRAIDYYRLRFENRRYQLQLEEKVRIKNLELTQALRKLQASFDFTLQAMASMLDSREAETGEHSQRVQDITCFLACEFGMTEPQRADMRQGALLHDIGKIATPDAILLKKSRLTEEEKQIMRKHVITGYNLIRSNPNLQAAAELMLCHHEAFDGTGYPNRLKGDQIPLGSRIFNLVDSYDAMRSDRPYRRGMSRDKALAEIRRNKGKQFDPYVVEVFLKKIDAIEEIGGWKR